MRKLRIDFVALVMAVVSFLLSVVAFGFSVYVFNVERAEVLSIEASLAMARNDLRCLPSTGDTLRLIQAPAKMVVSNNSDRTVSLVGYEVSELVGEGRRATYTDIATGLRDSQGAPLMLPFSLAAGESMSFEVVLGLLPAHSAKLILQESSLCGAQFTRRDVMQILGRESIDLYGNFVSFQERTDGIVFKGPPNGGRQQLFLLRFFSGRGGVFEAQATWYPSSEFFSGAF